MSHVEHLTNLIKDAGHVMGPGPGRDGLAAYHAAHALRDAARCRTVTKRLIKAQLAAKNWRVRVMSAQSPHRLIVEGPNGVRYSF